MSARESALTVALVLVGCLAVVIVFGSLPNRPAPIIDLHPPAIAPASVTTARVLGPIEAGALAEAFNQNEVRAEATYTGQRYFVRGFVREISTDAFGLGHLRLVSIRAGLAGPERSDEIDCVFDKDAKGQLAFLEKGNRVVVVGTVGQMLIGTVFVEHCLMASEPAAEPVPTRPQRVTPQVTEPEPVKPTEDHPAH